MSWIGLRWWHYETVWVVMLEKVVLPLLFFLSFVIYQQEAVCHRRFSMNIFTLRPLVCLFRSYYLGLKLIILIKINTVWSSRLLVVKQPVSRFVLSGSYCWRQYFLKLYLYFKFCVNYIFQISFFDVFVLTNSHLLRCIYVCTIYINTLIYIWYQPAQFCVNHQSSWAVKLKCYIWLFY